MAATRVLLIHGAATTATVWSGVIRLLPGLEVVAPQRAYSGELAVELAALAGPAEGAVVVGVSGGATLGLALLAAGVPVAGAVLHEPAVGSLVPGLLAHVAEGYAAHGVPGFGTALYGPAWDPAMAPAEEDAVRRDFAMFRAFEPTPLPATAAGTSASGTSGTRLLTTVGAQSPPARHAAARALRGLTGLPYRVLEGCGHAVHLERPEALAAVVRAVAADRSAAEVDGASAAPGRG
ncbi:alpha/beta fold hydrolase [Streptacidiphilus sp. N1-3]|uniref:Alpha/beta fold hydrolase n=1 Tax=Streptacidiphilus alkalitolerans TaxID=3342712 RepID=A0ABV6X839_9ACTN